ncbi:TPA: hypothetical protein SL338_003199 [Pseudomonas aeruginosa]|nr:hypothetical protein [Pseudomonas aeruginosa]
MMAVDVDRLSRPERLLWGHGVRKPEHIDLEAIAGASGAHVIYRKLDGCAARLVAAGDHAVISVAMDDNLGRRRFSLLIRQALFVNLARAEVSKPLDGLKLNGIGTLQ